MLKSLPSWTKILPNSWGGAMDKIPLLLEGLFQTSIGCLRVLARHLGHHLQWVSLYLDVLHDLNLLCGRVTDEAAKVADYGDHSHSHPPEV